MCTLGLLQSDKSWYLNRGKNNAARISSDRKCDCLNLLVEHSDCHSVGASPRRSRNGARILCGYLYVGTLTEWQRCTFKSWEKQCSTNFFWLKGYAISNCNKIFNKRFCHSGGASPRRSRNGVIICCGFFYVGSLREWQNSSFKFPNHQN